MSFILGISEGSLISIGLVVLPLLVATFLRYKAKADKSEIKSDIMIDVKKEISEKTDPIERRMDKHDQDFKDFKNNEIAPMKIQLNNLEVKQGAIDVKIDCIIDDVKDIKTLLVRLLDK